MGVSGVSVNKIYLKVAKYALLLCLTDTKALHPEEEEEKDGIGKKGTKTKKGHTFIN